MRCERTELFMMGKDIKMMSVITLPLNYIAVMP